MDEVLCDRDQEYELQGLLGATEGSDSPSPSIERSTDSEKAISLGESKVTKGLALQLVFISIFRATQVSGLELRFRSIPVGSANALYEPASLLPGSGSIHQSNVGIRFAYGG